MQLRAAAAEERTAAAEARLTQREAAMAANLAASGRAATIGDGLTQARFAGRSSHRALRSLTTGIELPGCQQARHNLKGPHGRRAAAHELLGSSISTCKLRGPPCQRAASIGDGLTQALFLGYALNGGLRLMRTMYQVLGRSQRSTTTSHSPAHAPTADILHDRVMLTNASRQQPLQTPASMPPRPPAVASRRV